MLRGVLRKAANTRWNEQIQKEKEKLTLSQSASMFDVWVWWAQTTLFFNLIRNNAFFKKIRCKKSGEI